LEWASKWDDKLPTIILRALDQCGPLIDPTCFIVAPNGTIGFELLVSKKGPATAKSLERPVAWHKALRLPFGKALPIARKRGLRMDIDHVLGRNGHGTPPLWNKDILLLGVGSIGGYLARALAQLGAGRGPTGRLTLVDDDVLKATNIGRHSLGTPGVGKPKVTAVREQLEADFPGAHVFSRECLAQTQEFLLSHADLVVEATGERGVSEFLNSLVINARMSGTRYPPVIYTWIEGAGAAVQTFFGGDPEFGCLRCLRPDFSLPSRFSALRDEANVELRGGCGEAFFMPYGPSAPMMAASLAAQHISDWNQGSARPILRTIRLDLGQTREVKPSNPRRAASCPACGSHGN
jgi:molybdopterin/thiamine biosynthesis adenylyltransferase